MALTRYHHLPMHFPAAIYCMQNFNIFCPWGPTMVCIWAKLKLVDFYRYFSQYNFKKSIRTLDKLQKRVDRTIGLPFRASLEPLTHCQLEASWRLYYRYYFFRGPSELAKLVRLPCFYDRSRMHDFSITILSYKDVYVKNFFHQSARPWNSLPAK